ncbi:hypothetical protein V1282_002672 [Nitrobacteraceae bacterium AZCC 2146]
MSGEISAPEVSPDLSNPNGDEPHRRHHPFFYIGGSFLNAVVFAAVGPLVGGPIFAAIGLVMTPHSNSLQAGSISGFLTGLLGYFYLFFITVPVSYYFSASAAFATGVIVAVLSIWLTYSRYLYLGAAIAGGIVSILQVSRSPKLDEDPVSFYAAAIAGALAAIVCTRVAKSFRLGVAAGTEPADGRLPAK